MESKEMVKIAINALEEKKAENIRIIDISKVSVLADYFIIAEGKNRNQIQALTDSVEKDLGKAGVNPKQIEGYESANWILMDYADIIVHIFDNENRLFYDLERIWRDGVCVDAKDFIL
ncbi:MAG: ribosome silencing factor [Lachnospiraceae bacterium]|nr:ribosome silencing factor [Lachnospiraceae bacterium]